MQINLIGNHELYNFDREQLKRRLHTARPGGHTDGAAREYYAVSPCAGWRFLVLDAYQDTVIRPERAVSHGESLAPSEAADHVRGLAILLANNPNLHPDAIKGGSGWFDGLAGHDRRFVPFNGGFGAKQVAWLRGQLAAAAEGSERVVVLCHAILHPGACEGTTMAWDFEAALAAIAEAPCGTVGVHARQRAAESCSGTFALFFFVFFILQASLRSLGHWKTLFCWMLAAIVVPC